MTTITGTAETATITPKRRSALGMLGHQVRFDLLIMARDRSARFFTLGLPVLMLVLFVAIFGTGYVGPYGHSMRASTYYVATQVVFGVVGAGFMTLMNILVIRRQAGLYKRRRATPVPAWAIVVSQAILGLVGAVGIAGLLLAIGALAFSVTVPPGSLAALAVDIAVGALSFCCLGFAVASLVRTETAAQPVSMGLALPLFFISGVFIPWDLIPTWMRGVASVFPVRPFAAAVLAVFGGSTGVWRPVDLLVVGAWGLAALALSARRLAWSPYT